MEEEKTDKRKRRVEEGRKSTLCVEIVVLPQGPKFVLPPYIPNGELQVFVLHRFHIKTCTKGETRGENFRGKRGSFGSDRSQRSREEVYLGL